MAEIVITCSKCQAEIKVNVKTIDVLRKDLKAITEDRDYYKAKLAALEHMNKTKPNNLFGDLFGNVIRK